MAMNMGWNPFFKNTKKSVEIHLIHEFKEDFYGAELQSVVVGYIRPEATFGSLGLLN